MATNNEQQQQDCPSPVWVPGEAEGAIDQPFPYKQYTPLNSPKRDRFLQFYAKTGNITRSAQLAGVQPSVHHANWMKSPVYQEMFKEARKRFEAMLEATAVRMSTEYRRKYKFGKNDEPVLHPDTGDPYYEEVPPDPTMVKFMLSNRLRGKYKERAEVKHEGTVSVRIDHDEVQKRIAEDAETLRRIYTQIGDRKPSEFCENSQPRALGMGDASGDTERRADGGSEGEHQASDS